MIEEIRKVLSKEVGYHDLITEAQAEILNDYIVEKYNIDYGVSQIVGFKTFERFINDAADWWVK